MSGAIGKPRGRGRTSDSARRSVSDNLCYRDAYARETQAAVQAVDPSRAHVLLDRTVFYPGGGGQPADQGWLRRRWPDLDRHRRAQAGRRDMARAGG